MNLDFNRAEQLKAASASKNRIDNMLDRNQEAKIFKTLIVNKEIQAKLEGDDGRYLTDLHETGKFIDELADRKGPEALDYRTALLNNHLEQLRESYESKERNYNMEALDFATRTDDLQEKILKSEKLVCDLNKEIVKQRIQFEQYEFELQNENEQMRRHNVEVAKKLASLENHLDHERIGIARSIEKMANQQSAKYKTKCRTREEETNKLKQRYKELQDQHFQKVKAMNDDLTKMKNQ